MSIQQITRALSLLLFVALFSSCRTGKSMQKEIRTMRANLYYELTSPEYKGEIIKDIFLNFIDYSNIDYHTTVRKTKTVFIPLILYNFSSQTYEITLGESSLTQNYREFLTDAFLAECNSSTCFNLINNEANIAPDSAYVLDVKVNRNRTITKIKLNESAIPWFDENMEEAFISFTNNKTRPAVTELNIHVRLLRSGKTLFDKEYSVKRSQDTYRERASNSYEANDVSLQTMTAGLSHATKEIVEQISSELHLLMFSL